MSSRIAQTLHEEHAATAFLFGRLESLVASFARRCPDCASPEVADLLRRLPSAIDGELLRHFDFEDKPLLEELAAMGETQVAAQLGAEHALMRPLARRLAQLAAEAFANAFTEASWRDFCAVSNELCALLRTHIEIEEQLLLPLLDETLDAAADERLYHAYAGNL